MDLRRLTRRHVEDERQGRGVTRAAFASRRVWALVALVPAVLAAGVAYRWWSNVPPSATPSPFQRITSSFGLEEQAAISPDGKYLAFIAPADGRRQVFYRALEGSAAPIQITRDDADHESPRWAHDSSTLTLIYFSRADPEAPGVLKQVFPLQAAPPQGLGPADSDADLSHNDRQIATFRREREGETLSLTILRRDGSVVERTKRLSFRMVSSPRWSPDDRWIAFRAVSGDAFNEGLYIIDAALDHEPTRLVEASRIQGLAWRNVTRLVYASSAGSSMLYPPIMNLWTVSRSGGPAQPLTRGGASYAEPDVALDGTIFASWAWKMQSHIAKIPIDGVPAENVARRTIITRQTAQVQTPSVSPDDSKVVYLSDSGGHANLWIADTNGPATYQVTRESNPSVAIGVPVWSPAGDRIVFVKSEGGIIEEWLVNPDGSAARRLGPGRAAVWSHDGAWLYYTVGTAPPCIEKVPADGGTAMPVRCRGISVAVSSAGSIYYAPSAQLLHEVWWAATEDGPGTLFSRVAPWRIPLWPQGYALSPDDQWLAMPLTDAGKTNIWIKPTNGGEMRQVTDFGETPTLIARQISWSSDSRSIYAAVVEIDTDIVSFQDLLTAE